MRQRKISLAAVKYESFAAALLGPPQWGSGLDARILTARVNHPLYCTTVAILFAFPSISGSPSGRSVEERTQAPIPRQGIARCQRQRHAALTCASTGESERRGTRTAQAVRAGVFPHPSEPDRMDEGNRALWWSSRHHPLVSNMTSCYCFVQVKMRFFFYFGSRHQMLYTY